MFLGLFSTEPCGYPCTKIWEDCTVVFPVMGQSTVVVECRVGVEDDGLWVVRSKWADEIRSGVQVRALNLGYQIRIGGQS